MSHQATNWAFDRVELEAGPWRVLAILADCHNPAHGCFPKQSHIAARCNMHRSTINRHLKFLEQGDYIYRQSAVDPDTKRQKTTRYLLGFEADFPCRNLRHGSNQKPCLNSDASRVSSGADSVSHLCDTNEPVNEPVIEPVIERGRGCADVQDSNTDVDRSEKLFKKIWERLPEKVRIGSSHQSALSAWQNLDDASLAASVEGIGGVYEVLVQMGRTKLPSVSTVIKDQKWSDLEGLNAEADHKPEMVKLAPFGKAWSSHRFWLLAQGKTGVFKPKSWQKKAIEAGKGDLFHLDKLRAEYPAVARFDDVSTDFGGALFRPVDVVPDHADFIQVAAGSDIWKTWCEWFTENDLPPSPCPDAGWIWMPIYKPDVSTWQKDDAA